MTWDVVFRYRDNVTDEDADEWEDGGGWQRQSYPTEAEARAFADGLTHGDEPLYEVDAVEPCTLEAHT